MTFTMRKPAWIGCVAGVAVVSPAAVLVLADWWDAWRLMWMGVGYAIDQAARPWERLLETLSHNLQVASALCRAYYDGFTAGCGPRPPLWRPGCQRSAPK